MKTWVKNFYLTELSDLSFSVNSVIQVKLAKHLHVEADASVLLALN